MSKCAKPLPGSAVHGAARPFVPQRGRPNGIRRALLPVPLAAATLACAFAIERPLACPSQLPPQPLLMLYKRSARVVGARIGAREVLKTEDDLASGEQ